MSLTSLIDLGREEIYLVSNNILPHYAAFMQMLSSFIALVVTWPLELHLLVAR